MRSRIGKLFNWRRVLRVAGGITVAGGTVAGLATVSLAAASCWTINRVRPRTYTDDYHLNPEILRMPYRNVEFSSEDGVTLKGWWVPATVHGRESDRIVVLMHPYNNHKSNLLGVASSLWYHGYSIFMFDFRSFASNPKTRQSIGYFEQYDAVAAINYVLNNYYYNDKNDDISNHKQMVLMGASMGGACAICSTKHFMADNVISAVVCDCTFSSLREICKYRIGVASALWFPTGLLDLVVKIMDYGNQFLYGYSVDDVNPSEIVNANDFDIPLLLIHSECDAAVPFSHSQHLYKKCRSKIKNLYCIKSGDHCGGYFINPNLFTKYLCQWVDDVLDHEILERKAKQKVFDKMHGHDNKPTNLSVNTDYIMFEAHDDIGLNEEQEKQLEHINDENDDENEHPDEQDTTDDDSNDDDEVVLNENSKVIIEGTASSSSSTMDINKKSEQGIIPYFTSFWKR